MLRTFLAYALVLSLAACNISNSANPNADLVDVKMLRFYANFAPGCGNNLSGVGLAMQQKGMKLVLDDILSTGNDFSYQYFVGGENRNDGILTLVRALDAEPRLLPAYFFLIEYFSEPQYGMSRTLDFAQRYKLSVDQVSPVMLVSAMREKCRDKEGKSPMEYLLLRGAYRQAAEAQWMCTSSVIEHQIEDAKRKLKKSPGDFSALRSLALWNVQRGDFEAARQAAIHLKEIDADGKYKGFTDKVLADIQQPEAIAWCNDEKRTAIDQKVNYMLGDMLPEYNGGHSNARATEEPEKEQGGK